MTHDELVERAGRWLLNTKRCKYVAVGRKPWSTSEHPDAIGWLPNGESIVVECKVSCQDLSADYRKSWRKHSKGMGFRRYYMTPHGLLASEWYCPRGSGWLECRGRIVKVMREADARQERDFSVELAFLLSQVAAENLSYVEEGKD